MLDIIRTLAGYVKPGDHIRINRMKAETTPSRAFPDGIDYQARALNGQIGTVNYIDDAGQLHGSWGGIAINPDEDDFTIIHKKAAIVYHKSDFDGIAAYAISRKSLEKEYVITAIPFNYGDAEPDLKTLLGQDLVVITDVCLAAATMKALYLETQNRRPFDCVWIDHYETSLDASVPGGWSLMHGYRQPSGKSACALAWDYFHGITSRVPRTVQLLSAYDIHNRQDIFNDWETEVMPFQYGAREAYDLRAEDFAKDFDALMYDDAFVAGLIRDGGRIYRHEKKTGSKGIEMNAFEVTIAGSTRGLCCLTSQFGSLAFEDRMEREGQEVAVCVNRISAEAYRVAMYAPGKCSLNLGKYMADNYGGGGHPGAAGGTLTFEQLKTLLTERRV